MSSQPTDKPPLMPLYAVVFIGTLGFSIVLPFLVFLVLRLGGNAMIYGLVGSAYSLCQLVGAPVLGAWSDRFGRRRILLLSQGGTAVAWLLFLVALALPITPLAAVDSAWLGSFTLTIPLVLVLLARALDGLTGGNISVANAYLADVTDEDSRQVAFGRLAMAQNLGFVVGPALAGLLGGWGEAAPIWAALTISGAALVLIAWRLPESAPCVWVTRPTNSVRKVLGQEQRDCHEAQGAKRLGLRKIFSLPDVGLLLGLQFLVFLAFNFFYVTLPVHSATSLDWTLREVGLFLAYFSALMVVSQGPLLSWASRKLSDGHLVRTGGALLAVGFATLSSGSAQALLLGVPVVALGNGLLWPSLLALVSRAAGSAQGAVQGVAGSTGAVASVLGLVIGGLVFERLGSGVFLLSSALAGLAFFSSIFLRPHEQLPPPRTP